ncbi:hypothetical protein QVD17_32426 [Tagetes erecta]|uniref:EF-hand domain-containing protein n=1 Tax=Tagetes erecta TaxID=13708 RepID=A0AAD8NKK6_TARER|nr:hypothetical protein QVD17_32426 [Tagetes erecta]
MVKEELREIIDRFDMNCDGSLTHLELAALLRSIGVKPHGDQIHFLLANIDSNGNGSIEFHELLSIIIPLINQQQLMDIFRSFDKYGKGYITALELA